jgi:hypothetical protein
MSSKDQSSQGLTSADDSPGPDDIYVDSTGGHTHALSFERGRRAGLAEAADYVRDVDLSEHFVGFSAHYELGASKARALIVRRLRALADKEGA